MLRQKLTDALKEAMRAKDTVAVATLRLILAALKDRDIAARTKGQGDAIGEDQILEMLQKMVRQRHDSIEMYSKGERQDLAEREGAEIEVIERFLPKAMSEEEMNKTAAEVIAELEAGSLKDMGRVMNTLKQRYPGRMDFGKASAYVKQALV